MGSKGKQKTNRYLIKPKSIEESVKAHFHPLGNRILKNPFLLGPYAMDEMYSTNLMFLGTGVWAGKNELVNPNISFYVIIPISLSEMFQSLGHFQTVQL